MDARGRHRVLVTDTDASPLILTLVLDAASQAAFDDLRRAHFPPERNHIAAHVTLFHALPGLERDGIEADVRSAVDRPSFEVAVVGLRSIGGGVAYDLEAPALVDLRRQLAARWSEDLSRQDRSGFRPHVTVQNKVAPAAARSLLAALEAGFVPWTCEAEGLALWWYRGGPWEHVVTARFPT